jgi:hypothetical protein
MDVRRTEKVRAGELRMKHRLLKAVAALVFVSSANAAPITTPPLWLVGDGGDVKAVYIFASASDSSILSLSKPAPAVATIFCNHNVNGCIGGWPGHMVDLGHRSGPLLLTLHDVTTGKTYDSRNADGFGDFHVDIRTSYTFPHAPPLTPAQKAALAALPDVTFVAWEDRDKSRNSDFDYNDLIAAFSNTRLVRDPNIPEPLTLSLFGAGLLGAFSLSRRKT